MRGGSVIVDPMGQVLAGPLYHKEGLVSAEIDLEDIVKAKYDMDVFRSLCPSRRVLSACRYKTKKNRC